MDWQTLLLLVFEALLPVIYASLAKNTELTRVSLDEVKDLKRNWIDNNSTQQAWTKEIIEDVKRNTDAINKILVIIGKK